eukprot:354902-Chlamydomonas_euryale.AAC.2
MPCPPPRPRQDLTLTPPHLQQRRCVLQLLVGVKAQRHVAHAMHAQALYLPAQQVMVGLAVLGVRADLRRGRVQHSSFPEVVFGPANLRVGINLQHWLYRMKGGSTFLSCLACALACALAVQPCRAGLHCQDSTHAAHKATLHTKHAPHKAMLHTKATQGRAVSLCNVTLLRMLHTKPRSTQTTPHTKPCSTQTHAQGHISSLSTHRAALTPTNTYQQRQRPPQWHTQPRPQPQLQTNDR